MPLRRAQAEHEKASGAFGGAVALRRAGCEGRGETGGEERDGDARGGGRQAARRAAESELGKLRLSAADRLEAVVFAQLRGRKGAMVVVGKGSAAHGDFGEAHEHVGGGLAQLVAVETGGVAARAAAVSVPTDGRRRGGANEKEGTHPAGARPPAALRLNWPAARQEAVKVARTGEGMRHRRHRQAAPLRRQPAAADRDDDDGDGEALAAAPTRT